MKQPGRTIQLPYLDTDGKKLVENYPKGGSTTQGPQPAPAAAAAAAAAASRETAAAGCTMFFSVQSLTKSIVFCAFRKELVVAKQNSSKLESSSSEPSGAGASGNFGDGHSPDLGG